MFLYLCFYFLSLSLSLFLSQLQETTNNNNSQSQLTYTETHTHIPSIYTKIECDKYIIFIEIYFYSLKIRKKETLLMLKRRSVNCRWIFFNFLKLQQNDF